MPVLTGKAVHVAQPDLNHTGGLLEGKRIAAVADAELIGIAPHNPNGPIAGVAALHYDVSTPNFLIQEEMSGAVPWYDERRADPAQARGQLLASAAGARPGRGDQRSGSRPASFKQEVSCMPRGPCWTTAPSWNGRPRVE